MNRSVPVPADLHEWVSFEDPDEDRTWIFDLTFLVSNWGCIFGRGCPGVLTGPAPELGHGCCSYGAHFSDDADRRRVEALADQLDDATWQHRRLARRRGGPVKVTRAGEVVTRLVDGGCIFLNRPGFAGGAGCALHRAALDRHQRPLDWKPDVCWQLPLRRIDEPDRYGHVTSTVREWKRRDWGDGGAEFHWWCTDAPDAFVEWSPVYETMADELVALVGEAPYRLFVDHVRARRAGPPGAAAERPAPERPAPTVFLPHPALRRRNPGEPP